MPCRIQVVPSAVRAHRRSQPGSSANRSHRDSRCHAPALPLAKQPAPKSSSTNPATSQRSDTDLLAGPPPAQIEAICTRLSARPACPPSRPESAIWFPTTTDGKGRTV